MNKSKVLPWICLLVLLFSGCEDASDSIKDQAPTPIEEEREVQDPVSIQVAEKPAAEEDAPEAVYFEEKRWRLQFGDAEIYDGDLVVGAYASNIAYFELDAAMKAFGWTLTDQDVLSIQKGDLTYELSQELVQRTFLDERGSPYMLQFPLRDLNDKTMIAQYDMERLFGLQSHWDPESRVLTLVEWGWDMPEKILARAVGDQIYAAMAFRARAGNVWVIDYTPSIDLKDLEGRHIHGRSGGYATGDVFLMESQGQALIPGQAWQGRAWIMCQGRPLGLYPIDLIFDPASGQIEISQGPWEEFSLEAPVDFYTIMDQGLAIEGWTEDEAVEIVISRLQEGAFDQILTTGLEGGGPFSFSYGLKETGIYRIDIWTLQDGTRQNRTHFYVEKE